MQDTWKAKDWFRRFCDQYIDFLLRDIFILTVFCVSVTIFLGSDFYRLGVIGILVQYVNEYLLL